MNYGRTDIVAPGAYPESAAHQRRLVRQRAVETISDDRPYSFFHGRSSHKA
jgi:hypothetical protein